MPNVLEFLLATPSLFPRSSIIFGMSQQVPNINFAAVKMDRGDQSIFITGDVEHHPAFHFVSAWECFPKFIKACKFRPLDDLKPARQRPLAIRMLFPELPQCLARNDVH